MDYIIPIEVYSIQITLPQLGSTSLNIFSSAKTHYKLNALVAHIHFVRDSILSGQQLMEVKIFSETTKVNN